jgi:hypothetical protein
MPLLVASQETLYSSQTSGWSSEAVVTSTVFGLSSLAYVSGLPQSLQIVRKTPGDDWKLLSSPRRSANFLRSNVTHPTAGAALAFLQLLQWQTIEDSGTPLTR